ncbi:MAG: zinc ribbon domain-containing protein [Lachnospiraceae bacterium]|nr:zinc ribbon domain-containing protein [Lachnospiraceae bacterium]
MAFCRNCGAQLAEGAAFCNNCGAAAGGPAQPQQPAQMQPQMPQPQMQPQGGMQFQQPQQAVQQPQQAVPQMQQDWQAQQQTGGKKSKKGLIIGLSVGGTVLIAGIVLLILFLTGVFGGSKKEGLYKAVGGDDFDPSEEQYYLELLGDGCGNVYYYNAYWEEWESEPVNWNDDNIFYDGERLSANFSGSRLTLSYDGYSLVFEKTDDPLPEISQSVDNPPVSYKPVIYLYPEEELQLTLQIDLDGRLTHIYPAFDEGYAYGKDMSSGTWTVTARPDGTLIDGNGKTYYCLFWEGEQNTAYDFSEGAVVKGSETAAFLEHALAAQGLSEREANEFLIYWLPQMEGNAYNLISFQQDAYTDTARLSANPSPDTVIRVFMAYMPLEDETEALAISETLPAQTFTAPGREGFTLVEWGGTEVK